MRTVVTVVLIGIRGSERKREDPQQAHGDREDGQHFGGINTL